MQLRLACFLCSFLLDHVGANRIRPDDGDGIHLMQYRLNLTASHPSRGKKSSRVSRQEGSIENGFGASPRAHGRVKSEPSTLLHTDDRDEVLNTTPRRSASVSPKKPHIILILADDMGWNGVGYNNPDVKSPYIDNLATKEGVILASFYTAPVCAPSRFSLLTGRDAWKAEGYGTRNLHSLYPVGTSLGYKMLPAALKEVGYETHMLGKWHQGYHRPEYLPTSRGFDSFDGILGGTSGHFTHVALPMKCDVKKMLVDLTHDTQPMTEVSFKTNTLLCDTRYREKAVELIRGHGGAGKPFFLYLSLQLPHEPFQVTDKYRDMYNFADERKNVYYGMLSHVDGTVKAVVEELRVQKMYENSLVLFMSDNGPSNHAPTEMSGPFRGHKGTVLEGGIRVPAFVAGGIVPTAMRGRRISDLVSIADWYATLAHLTGAVVDDGGPSGTDSINQWPVLSGKSASAREHLVQLLPAPRCQNDRPHAAVVTRDWKFLHMPGVSSLIAGKCLGRPCLFDHGESHAAEIEDVSETRPTVLAALQALADDAATKAADARFLFTKKVLEPVTFLPEACKSFSAVPGNHSFITPWAGDEMEHLFSTKGDACAFEP